MKSPSPQTGDDLSRTETQVGYPITVAVMAGGKSRRMGRDKAAIEISGISLLEHVCRAASNAGLPVIVIGRNPNGVPKAIAEQWKVIPDDTSSRGPLGGLATALCHSPGNSILLCATDIPHVKSEDFLWLTAQTTSIANHPKSGIVTTRDGNPEPLFAVYHQSIHTLVSERIALAQLSMRELLDAGDFQLVELPEKHSGAIIDVDSPEDLAQIIHDSEYRNFTNND